MRIDMERMETLINRDLGTKYTLEHNHQELEDTNEGTGIYAAKIMGNLGEEHHWPDAFAQGVDLGIKLACIYAASPLSDHFQETSDAIDSADKCQREVYAELTNSRVGV